MLYQYEAVRWLRLPQAKLIILIGIAKQVLSWFYPPPFSLSFSRSLPSPPFHILCIPTEQMLTCCFSALYQQFINAGHLVKEEMGPKMLWKTTKANVLCEAFHNSCALTH